MVRRVGVGDRGTVAFGYLETLSWGGALLHLEEPLPESSVAELTICLAGGVIRTRARVLYHRRMDEGVAVGVEFLELDEDGVDLLDRLVTPRRRVPRRRHAPRCERWPFLLFGPAAPPGPPS